jgi:hypothetical protein
MEDPPAIAGGTDLMGLHLSDWYGGPTLLSRVVLPYGLRLEDWNGGPTRYRGWY